MLQWPGIEPGPAGREASVLTTLLLGLDTNWKPNFLTNIFSYISCNIGAPKGHLFSNFFSTHKIGSLS